MEIADESPTSSAALKSAPRPIENGLKKTWYVPKNCESPKTQKYTYVFPRKEKGLILKKKSIQKKT